MSHGKDEDNTDDAKNAVREEEALNEGIMVPDEVRMKPSNDVNEW